MKFVWSLILAVSAEVLDFEKYNLETGEITRVRRDSSDFQYENHSRQRREIFGMDERYPLTKMNTTSDFPFDTVVKINAGCSGILISPRHVLTCAHCIHNGTHYPQQLKKLRIGTLRQMKTTRRKSSKKNKKKKKKKKRGVERRRRDTSENSDQALFESIFTPYKRTRVSRQSRQSRNNNDQLRRIKERKAKKSFKWVKAKEIMIPNGWKHTQNSGEAAHTEHDYAVIELKKDAGADYMRFTISPNLTELHHNRIHFSSFDLPQYDHMSYRFCKIRKQNTDLIFQQCDAESGSSGAGIYVRYFVPEMGKKGQFQRKIIGIFAGNVKSGQYGDESFNVGVRITPEKYNHICFWINAEKPDTWEYCNRLLEEQKRRRPYVRKPLLG